MSRRVQYSNARPMPASQKPFDHGRIVHVRGLSDARIQIVVLFEIDVDDVVASLCPIERAGAAPHVDATESGHVAWFGMILFAIASQFWNSRTSDAIVSPDSFPGTIDILRSNSAHWAPESRTLLLGLPVQYSGLVVLVMLPT